MVSSSLHQHIAATKPELARCLSVEEQKAYDLAVSEQSVRFLRDAIDTSESTGDAFPSWRIRQELDIELGRWFIRLERYQEAENHLLSAYERFHNALSDRHVCVTYAADLLSQLYVAWGRPAEMEKYQAITDMPVQAP